MVNLDEIRKRWGDAKKGSQYYADVHALMDEVESLSEDNKAFEETMDGWQERVDALKVENRRLREALTKYRNVQLMKPDGFVARRALEEIDD